MAQLMDVLMVKGSWTPHLLGMPAAVPALRPEILPAADLRQAHAAWRSGVVRAAALSDLTPLQHPAGGCPPAVRA